MVTIGEIEAVRQPEALARGADVSAYTRLERRRDRQ